MTYLPRRMRKQRSSVSALWHISAPQWNLTAEEAEQLRAQFMKAQRSGTVVTNDQVQIRRIR